MSFQEAQAGWGEASLRSSGLAPPSIFRGSNSESRASLLAPVSPRLLSLPHAGPFSVITSLSDLFDLLFHC